MADTSPSANPATATTGTEGTKPLGAPPGGKGTPPAPAKTFRELSPAETLKLANDDPETYREYMSHRSRRFMRGG